MACHVVSPGKAAPKGRASPGPKDFRCEVVSGCRWPVTTARAVGELNCWVIPVNLGSRYESNGLGVESWGVTKPILVMFLLIGLVITNNHQLA